MNIISNGKWKILHCLLMFDTILKVAIDRLRINKGSKLIFAQF